MNIESYEKMNVHYVRKIYLILNQEVEILNNRYRKHLLHKYRSGIWCNGFLL